jgi:pilus assembly protein CpaB
MDRRRILILFGVAWISAALLTWFLYANTVAPQKEQRTQIVAARRDIMIGEMIRKTDLKTVAVLARDIPKGGLLTDKDALNRVALYPVSANEPLNTSKLSALSGAEGIPATIDPGHRAVSVQITDVSGVAGLIEPGAHVDVLFTRPGSMTEAITSTILQNVRVLAMGRATQVGQTIDPKAPKVPVATLIVTPEEAQKLELARNQGRISLSLRNPLDSSSGVDGTPVSTDILDPTLSVRLARERRLRNAPDPRTLDPNDTQTFERLSGGPRVVPKKEPLPAPPPPPRTVVDVFRGDKHVQESFPQ